MTSPSESPNIYQRLHAIMSELGSVRKVQKQFMDYRTVSHDDVMLKVKPLLIAHGVVTTPEIISESVQPVTWSTKKGERKGYGCTVHVRVHFTSIDDPASTTFADGVGIGMDPTDKGAGKALSYAVKYAYLKAFNLETGEDSDNEDITYNPDNVVAQESNNASHGPEAPISKDNVKYLAGALVAHGNAASGDSTLKERFLDYVESNCSTREIDELSYGQGEHMAQKMFGILAKMGVKL